MKEFFSVLLSPESSFKRIEKQKFMNSLMIFIVISVLSAITSFLLLSFQSESLSAIFSLFVANEEQLAQVEFITTIAVVAMAPIGLFFFMLFRAISLSLIKLVVGGSSKFKSLLKVAMYSNIPILIGNMVLLILLYVTKSAQLGDIALDLGIFISNKTSLLYYVLASFNPFAIWSLSLLVIGAATLFKKSKVTVGTWVFGGWLIFILILSFIQSNYMIG